MNVLEITALTYTYAGAPAAGRPALRDVSLAVQPGELVVLAGVSGCGKSTLLRAACGLVPHFHGGALAGRVVVAGLDTREHGPGELAAVCGTLLQDPETQVVMGTVRSELAFPLENRGLGRGAVAREVEEVALALGIARLLDRPTHELSGGELQRVALGAALAGRPELVLLDEPTSQLDPVAGDELIWLVRRLNEQWGTAVVLAEQRLERCLPAADRVVALVDGAVACDAAPADFLAWSAGACPDLQTPAARIFDAAGLRPLPCGVKEARAGLRERGLGPLSGSAGTTPSAAVPAAARKGRRGRRRGPAAAVELDRVWCEIPAGPAVLRGISVRLAAGERVALMGRNGAGKSTVLRHAAGLATPTRGRVATGGRVALLLQNPGDYLVHERVGDELGSAALAAAGLGHLADRHPRDLSGGERQRLALAIVTAPDGTGGAGPAVVCLDEPTRGMDPGHRAALVALLQAFARAGSAVLVATHDPELAAGFADRVVLMGEGEIVADGPTAEILGSGWYFATETARVLGGAEGALLPAQGAAVLKDRIAARSEVVPV